MYSEGVLDRQFEQIQMLQEPNDPGFIADCITLFCDETERILTEMSKYVERPVIDYSVVDAYVHQLKGISSSVGTQQVKLACVDYHHACENNDHYGSLRALNIIKHEFYNIRNKFQDIVQIERRITTYGTKQ